MSLTADERLPFKAEQLAQVDRLCEACLAKYIDLDTSDYEQNEGESIAAFNERKSFDAAAHRAKVVGRLQAQTADQLRARVNVDGFRGSTPVYGEHNDYTPDEMDAIASGYKANVGRAWGREIPAILADAAELKAELDADLTLNARTKAALIKHLLKAR